MWKVEASSRQTTVLYRVFYSDIRVIMWAYLRTSRSDGSGGSRSTKVSLGSTISTLSLGTRLTISTLRF